MFVKQAKVVGRNKKALEVGCSLEIHLENGRRIDGSVDFISNCQGASNIFIGGSAKNRFQLKVYSTRTLVELIIYSEDSLRVNKVKEVTVCSNGKPEIMCLKDLSYFTDENTIKLVPVVVGDIFSKHDREFKVLAIAKNEDTMFMEDTVSGAGIVVKYNDSSLIQTFRGFAWGNPTR